MTEPPRAAGGRLAEGWARNAFAVGCSGGRRDRGPLTEAGVRPAACGGSRAGAWRGCGRWGSPPLFPVPGPAACLRAGGRLAPRGSVMTEPPRAAGGRRAEGWARNAFAVG